MTKLLLIRHATTNSVGKTLAGRSPHNHLNEEGNAEAAKLAERLSGNLIHALYSSPLERAIETAAPMAKALQIDCKVDNDFIEIDFGAWTNRTIEELKYDAQFQRFNLFRSGSQIPGGDYMLEAQTRMVKGIAKLCRKHPNQTIIVVSHSDMIKAAIAHYAGIHLDMFQRIEISPASVSIIDLFEDTARIILLNHTGGIPL